MPSIHRDRSSVLCRRHSKAAAAGHAGAYPRPGCQGSGPECFEYICSGPQPHREQWGHAVAGADLSVQEQQFTISDLHKGY